MITVQATELNGNTFQKFRLLDTSSEVQARRPTRVPRGLSRSTQDLLAQRLVRAVTPEPSTEQIVEVHGRVSDAVGSSLRMSSLTVPLQRVVAAGIAPAGWKKRRS
jgi:hypothetical protein